MGDFLVFLLNRCMRFHNPNYQPDLSFETRNAITSEYKLWNGDYHWDVHLNLRPRSQHTRRANFTTEIGCAFADVERAILGDHVFRKNKADPRYRIHRSVFVESEQADIHAHILVHLPTPQTHVTHYQDVDLESQLRATWFKRCNLKPDKNLRNFHWQPIVSGGINGYPVKECNLFGNTENWDYRSSYIPK